MTETPNRHEFIKTIRPRSAAELTEFLGASFTENLRVIVLIIENSFPIDDAEIYENLENFSAPVILALKDFAAAADEKLVDACHLCIASENSRIGNRSAHEALKLNLVNKIASTEKVKTEAISLAEKIGELAPLAIRACLKAVREGLKLPLEEGLKIETELFAEIFSTADMREGTGAFLEKRKPFFQGK